MARQGERSVIVKRSHQWPLFVGPVSYRRGEDPAHLILQSSSGSLVAGDNVSQRIRTEAQAWLRVQGQGAMSVNTCSQGHGTTERQTLEATEGSRLEWQSEPRILHSGADHSNTVEIDVDATSSVLLVDTLVVHPNATAGRYQSSLTVRRTGTTVARDRVELDLANLASGSYSCYGIVWLVGAGDDLGLDGWSERSPDGTYAAASRLPHSAGFAIRIAAPSGLALRHLVTKCLQATSAAESPDLTLGP